MHWHTYTSQVNSKQVSKDAHDDVAGAIREGCSPKPLVDDYVESCDTESSETEESEVSLIFIFPLTIPCFIYSAFITTL